MHPWALFVCMMWIAPNKLEDKDWKPQLFQIKMKNPMRMREAGRKIAFGLTVLNNSRWIRPFDWQCAGSVQHHHAYEKSSRRHRATYIYTGESIL